MKKRISQVEINEAWKAKAVRDPTILPKGKSQAKYEAVTLPENQPADLGEIEQPLQFSNSDTRTRFQRSSYMAMKLDSIDVSHNVSEVDLPQDHHQADVANITLYEPFDSYKADAGLLNQFERMYQSWLQNTSDIVSRRGSKRKHLHLGSMHSVKMARLMDLPPVALACGLLTNENGDIYYPLPLLKQWMRSTQPLHDSPSGKTSPPHPPAPSSSSPPDRNNYHGQTRFPYEIHHSGVGSGSSVKIRLNINNHKMPSEIPMEAYLMNNGVAEVDLRFTPSNSVTGDEVRSIPTSESRPGIVSHGSDVNSGRSNKKILFSSSRRSGSSLEAVAEELSWNHAGLDCELDRVSETERDLAPENDLSGPTQTQKVPVPDQPVEKLTDSIRKHLKMHFDTPGSAETESLNQLALGLNRKKAACLFYQTCVLASRDFIRVEQKAPYGNILISRGTKT